MVLEVTDATFQEEVLNSDLPVIVDFWAPWCGPCRMVSPVVEAISEKYVGKLKTVKLNTDENQQTAVTYRITGIPSLVIIKGGQAVDRIVGFQPQPAMEATISKYL